MTTVLGRVKGVARRAFAKVGTGYDTVRRTGQASRAGWGKASRMLQTNTVYLNPCRFNVKMAAT